MAPTKDEESAFVFRHPRFVGLSPTPGKPGTYTVRLLDRTGHLVRITAPLEQVMTLAADALRRTDGDVQ